MNLSEKILTTVASLPEAKQVEVLDFVEYLKLKTEKEESNDWNSFSITSAMRDMENEDSNYAVTDLKETWNEPDFQQTGLKQSSLIRASKLAVVDEDILIGKLGL